MLKVGDVCIDMQCKVCLDAAIKKVCDIFDAWFNCSDGVNDSRTL